MDFDNLAQSTAEDRSAFTNLTTANATIVEQVPLYANCLSTKEADNVALQTAMKKSKGEDLKPQGQSFHPQEIRPLWRCQQ